MIALASDHAGFELKEAIKKHLGENNYDILDFGTKFHRIRRLSAVGPEWRQNAVTAGECDKAHHLLRTGIGVSIVAI